MKHEYSHNWQEEIENRLLKIEQRLKDFDRANKKLLKKALKEGYYYSCDAKKWKRLPSKPRKKITEKPSKKYVYSYDQKKWVNV